MDRKTAAAHITSSATEHLEESDRAAFREVAETEVGDGWPCVSYGRN